MHRSDLDFESRLSDLQFSDNSLSTSEDDRDIEVVRPILSVLLKVPPFLYSIG